MHEGAPRPQSQESGNELVEKVKGLESKIKGLNWHKRIAYALAIVGALGFAAEKVDNMADENAKKVVRDKIERIKGGIDLLEANDVKPGGVAGMVLDWSDSYAEEIESVLDHSDKSTFERMVSSAESVD